MEVVTRSEALQKGAKIYFTGQPCRNGHVNYRYVKNGACSECVKANNLRPVDPSDGARREAAAQLVQVKLRLFQADVEVMKAAALAFAVMRFPVLQMGDVYPGVLPTKADGGTALYRFNCHVDDVAALRDMAGGMLGAGSVDGQAARRAIFGKLADVQVAPVPEWARIPRPGDFDYK